ncbi:MAG: AAA family ATPase [Chloroflexota bacterium]|nr:AAA family ATPase [Chloroflexota bacterium]
MTPPNLFDHRREKLIQQEQPLAARMRPRTLDEFVGQGHIVGPGRLLRRAIQADQLSSVIFYGPPGTGKTTLAMVIANTTQAHFIAINAVLGGVKDIRNAIAVAQDQRGIHGRKTILFVDEVHRFNKAQQDALLPWVENGTVILVGATTENPYFAVNRPLVSRSRIFQLKPLVEADLYAIARQALADRDRGYGRLPVELDENALDHLVNVANGDARAVLNALELAVETTPPNSNHGFPDTDQQIIRVTLAVAEESIQRRAVLYDKEGDYHFDTISAFIKSLRGSDPDAALYWLAKMVYAGEDPRFIFRRMLIFASEDVGLADPDALTVVVSAATAFDRVGLPEGRFHLSQATLYLATAAKSNSTMGFFDALNAVEQEREAEVPTHLRDASRDSEGFGHGEGYLYPHAYRDHWVAQQYLPESLQGKVFYQPGDQGAEAGIKAEVQRHREAQLAAMVEGDGIGPPEILTFSGDRVARQRDQWLQRTVSGTGQRLGAVRDRVLDVAGLQRHSVVLDLNAGSGLLTWEALRRVPEGGVYALARGADGQALAQQANRLGAAEQPIILQGELADLKDLLASSELDSQAFDAIVGRNALGSLDEKMTMVSFLGSLLAEDGVLSLVETVPVYTQRLYELLDRTALDSDLVAALVEAEEAIYRRDDDPMVNWNEEDLRAALDGGNLTGEVVLKPEQRELIISQAMLDRWFQPSSDEKRPSYRDHLARTLTADDLKTVQKAFRLQLSNATVSWSGANAFLKAGR